MYQNYVFVQCDEQFWQPSYPDKLLFFFVSTIQWKWTGNNSKFTWLDKKNGPEDFLVIDNFREFLPPNEVDLQRVIEKKCDRIGRKMRTFHQCM